MSGRYFYGWNVVAATFVMALFSFGLGFYGLSVYVATLQRIHGWSASAVSAPVTVYYVAGALLTMVIGAAFERFVAENQASNKLRSERCRRVIGSAASM